MGKRKRLPVEVRSIALPSPILQTHTIGCGASGIEPLSTNHILHLEKSFISHGSEGRVYSKQPPEFAEYPSSLGSNHLPEVAHEISSPNSSIHPGQGLDRDYRAEISPDCAHQIGFGDKRRTPRCLCRRKKYLASAGIAILLPTIILVSLASNHHLDRASSANGSAVSSSSVPDLVEK